MNYIGEKGCNLQLLSITFVISSVITKLMYLFISCYKQYLSMLILKGSGDYGYIFAPGFNFELKF